MKKKYIPETDFEKEEFKGLIDSIKSIEYRKLSENFNDELFKELEEIRSKEKNIFNQIKKTVDELIDESPVVKKSKSTVEMIDSEVQRLKKIIEKNLKFESKTNDRTRMGSNYKKEDLGKQNLRDSDYKKLTEVSRMLKSIEKLTNKELLNVVLALKDIKRNI